MNRLDAHPELCEVTNDEIQELRAKSYNATLIRRIDITSDLARFQIRPDGGVAAFKPGQYVALGLGYWEPRIQPSQAEEMDAAKLKKMVRRAYSISCPMLDEVGQLAPCGSLDYLEFYVVLVRFAVKPPGLTPRLFLMREGDRLTVEKKIVGHYVMEAIKPNDTVVFMGTGTGEAPHNAMVTELLSQGHQGRIVTATCVRKREDLGYLSMHRELERKYPQYRYLVYTTREPENLDPHIAGYVGKQYLQSELSTGRLEAAAGVPFSPTNTHVFLCGNPEMIGYEPPGAPPLSTPGLLQILESRGFQRDGEAGPGLIRFEKYW